MDGYPIPEGVTIVDTKDLLGVAGMAMAFVVNTMAPDFEKGEVPIEAMVVAVKIMKRVVEAMGDTGNELGERLRVLLDEAPV